MKGIIDNCTILIGYINISLLIMGRTTRHQIDQQSETSLKKISMCVCVVCVCARACVKLKHNKRCIKTNGERKPLLTNAVKKLVIYEKKIKTASHIKYQNKF